MASCLLHRAEPKSQTPFEKSRADTDAVKREKPYAGKDPYIPIYPTYSNTELHQSEFLAKKSRSRHSKLQWSSYICQFLVLAMLSILHQIQFLYCLFQKTRQMNFFLFFLFVDFINYFAISKFSKDVIHEAQTEQPPNSAKV